MAYIDYCSSTATTGAYTVWANWCTTTAATTATTWTTWCSTTCSTGTTIYVEPTRETPETIALYQEQVRLANERAAAEKQRREAAEARAELLLLRFLDVQQREDYRRDRRFTVHGRNKRRYVVRHGTTHNIDRVGADGRITHNVCAYIPGVPVPDNLLMQKMLLENDDEAFCRKGNVFGNANEHRNGQTALPALQ